MPKLLTIVVIALVVGLAIWAWNSVYRPKLFPELVRFDKSDREKILWKAQAGWKATLCGAALGLAGYGFFILAVNSTGLGVHAVWGMVVMMPVAVSSPQLLYRRHIQRMLREELMAMGKPVCLKCGYNLTGNVSGRCPECGNEAVAADSVE